MAKTPDEIVEDGTVWWFGAEAWGPACRPDYHVETPVGQQCLLTGDVIKEDDCGFVMISADDAGELRKPVLKTALVQSITGQLPHTNVPEYFGALKNPDLDKYEPFLPEDEES